VLKLVASVVGVSGHGVCGSCYDSRDQVTRIVGVVNGASVRADMAGEVAVGIVLIGEGVDAGEARMEKMLR
jgi:hypothetical protein